LGGFTYPAFGLFLSRLDGNGSWAESDFEEDVERRRQIVLYGIMCK